MSLNFDRIGNLAVATDTRAAGASGRGSPRIGRRRETRIHLELVDEVDPPDRDKVASVRSAADVPA